MSLINKIETKSEQEVIQILRENGIQVIMKPIALIPDNMIIEGFGRQSIGLVEMNIYDALSKLENISKIDMESYFL